VVFNLVESLDGSDRLIPLVPALLERMGQPFTGAPADALFLATNKPLAKSWLRAHGLPTPDWWRGEAPALSGAESRWIVKSVAEQASLGLDDGAVIRGVAAARGRVSASLARHGGEWFAERFVEGRELNVSLLTGPQGPVVLPIAEIEFRDYPEAKPRIVGYDAKWDACSFEYRNTVRRFLDGGVETGLVRELRRLALRCWEIFGLRGAARVDFRVDGAGRPWVIEVNANPCLSPDAGFAAALEEGAVPFREAVRRIVAGAWGPVGDGSDG
jgi:D-alanine-D-alanine ligase